MTTPATGIAPKISAALDFSADASLNDTSYFVKNGLELGSRSTGFDGPANNLTIGSPA